MDNEIKKKQSSYGLKSIKKSIKKDEENVGFYKPSTSVLIIEFLYKNLLSIMMCYCDK